MERCCGGEGYDEVFDDKFARKVAKRYRKRGLNTVSQKMVDFVCERGIEGASVLEIGGGVGEIQLELLRRGAASVTNLEISTSYEDEARRLIDKAGMTGRVTRKTLDIVQAPDEVEPADIVVLHRVVCCYPDYEALLSAAGSHAKRLLVFSHPPRNIIWRIAFGTITVSQRLRRQSFRPFLHPPKAMVSVLGETGLTPRLVHRSLSWNAVGLER